MPHLESTRLLPALLLLGLTTSACAARYEGALRADLRRVGERLQTEPAPPTDGSLASAVRCALDRHPALRAAHARWRAQTLRIEAARRLPEPTVSYGFYASPVQTRVGPQRHRLSVRQQVPWPSRLSEAADAQSIQARAAQRRYEARALMLRAEVADAWWAWWAVRATRARRAEHVPVLESLAEVLRARLAVDGATVGQVSQVELRLARLRDALESLDEDERAARARLAARVYAEVASLPEPPLEVPGAAQPSEPDAALSDAIESHPLLEQLALSADAHDATARAVEGSRFPSLSLGVDWIETGAASMPVQGSGDDAVIVSVGVTVPLWQGAYEGLQRAAEAEGVAARADREAARAGAEAELTVALTQLRDSARRLALFESTLVPQARAALESVLGELVVGRSTIPSALLAQRELLELRLATVALRARHGRAWAQLERVVGRPVRAEAFEPGGAQ